MRSAREWAGDRRLAYDEDRESEEFYAEIQRDAQVELKAEVERLRAVAEAAKDYASDELDQRDGEDPYDHADRVTNDLRSKMDALREALAALEKK